MHRSGTLLAGRYRVIRHVGSGAMGTVYLAHDTTLGRDVAVKSVHAEPESDHGRRIMREARLGAGLRHPHLVTVYDVVPEDGALLLVMEFVDGETLADALRRGPLDVPRALGVLRATAAALDHAHSRGVVHRDVKPANVLLGATGSVKLADLGIATADDVSRITKTGGTLGTVAYMAPEQFEPGPVTPAVDVYALATVAFEALAGRRPYPGSTAYEVFGRLREGAAPPDLREVRPEMPEQAAGALARGMAVAPAARPGSAGALVDELEAAFGVEATAPEEQAPDEPEPAPDPTRPFPAVAPLEQEEAPTRPSATPATIRRRRLGLLVPLALVALVGVVVALVAGSGGGEEAEDRPSREQAARTAARTVEPDPVAPPAQGQATPEDAVRAFYTRAAEGDLDGSWRLAGPRMRAEFGNSRAAFEDTLGSLRAITFNRLQQTGQSDDTATIAIETVAEHTDRTDRCTGTVQTVRSRKGRWLVEPLGVRCVSG